MTRRRTPSSELAVVCTLEQCTLDELLETNRDLLRAHKTLAALVKSIWERMGALEHSVQRALKKVGD